MTAKNNKNMKALANERLNAAKNKFDHVIVIGMNNDTSAIDLSSTVNQYPFLHWMLNKTIFELNILEKQNTNVEKTVEGDTNAA